DNDVPVIILSAKTDEEDIVRGLDLGADDYVTKPFRVQPLMHRISALLRRADTEESGTVPLNLHGLQIDRENFRFEVDGVEHELTPTEFRMLWTLMAQPGRPFSRSELMETARGDDANALERTIDVHIRSLRRKLGSKANLIETVRGVGYRIARP
ncbi:MAG: winged helix-turn-helix domain-containing protein, partial [Planctomycetaceae bacterium]